MFSFFKKKDRKMRQLPATDPVYDFKWLDAGVDNPYNRRILDIRPFTQHMTSTTTDPIIATLFLQNREGVGQEYAGCEFENSISIDVRLIYPHNGEKIEGAGYKAKEMEDKWDIYAWNDILYFVRSWTGELCYRAFITYDDESFIVNRIEFKKLSERSNEQSMAINNIHFLISTLTFHAVRPHKIPEHLNTNEEIAGYSFSLFGRNCWCATYDDITDIAITQA